MTTTVNNYIDALTWGTSAESIATLGAEVVDRRIPPDQYHLSGLQLVRFRDSIINVTTALGGGWRVAMKAANANQFATGEHGFQVNTDGSNIRAQFVADGGTPRDIPAAKVTAKGDLIAWSGSQWEKLAAGANGTVLTADSTASGGFAWARPSATIADPGTGAAIPVTKSGTVAIVTAAAETNTLATPSFLGQWIVLSMDTRVGGDRVITASQTINQAGNTIMTFGAVRDTIRLEAITVGGALRWQVAWNEGVALS